jgi:hypothetical protein
MNNKPFLPKWAKAILIILALGLLFLIVIYPLKLGHLKISTDPTAWGVLGDYYNFIISSINTIAVIILSYAVYKAQIRRDEWEQKHLEVQEKPSLIFVAHDGQYYKLYNMGKGTAHKLIIGKVMSGTDVIENPPYKAYSIPPGGHIIVNWATNAAVLYAYYESEKDIKYLTKCKEDVNEEISMTQEGQNIMKHLKENAQRKEKITLILS